MGADALQRSQSQRGTRLRAAVVDDDKLVLDMLGTLLETEGFEVRTFSDGKAAFETFENDQPDIAIVDLNMPDMDGMELVKRVRAQWDFPVIMVTGGSDELDEAMGLRMGADDYVRKPFTARLLVERIHARLRRSARAAAVANPVRDAPASLIRGSLSIDAERHAVSWCGEPVTLTVTEFQLLEALARRPGVVKSRDQLMDVAYSDQIYVEDRTIDSHIKRLRKKFRAVDPEFSAIETLYGVGYRFIAD